MTPGRIENVVVQTVEARKNAFRRHIRQSLEQAISEIDFPTIDSKELIESVKMQVNDESPEREIVSCIYHTIVVAEHTATVMLLDQVRSALKSADLLRASEGE